MFFLRCPKLHFTGITSRRLAAAARAVKRDIENNALTPDLIKFASPEERIKKIDEEFNVRNAAHRKDLARQWRSARCTLAKHPKRLGILRHWQRRIYPGYPVYLLSLIHEVDSGILNLDQYENDLATVAEIGRAWRNKMDAKPRLTALTSGCKS